MTDERGQVESVSFFVSFSSILLGLVHSARFDFAIHGSSPLPASEWAHFQAEQTRSGGITLPKELEFDSWCSWDHMVTNYNRLTFAKERKFVISSFLFFAAVITRICGAR